MRAILVLLLGFACAGHTLAQDQNQLDISPTLFSVFAALNAAGYDADIDSAANHPLRKAVRDHLNARNLASVADLKRFRQRHRKNDPAAELSQYVSFALSVKGPPDFEYRFRKHEIPPDVVPLEGFEYIMTRFHREADIDELWERCQPAFEEVLARYQEPVTRAVMEVNAYLRHLSGGYLGRRFQIYIDLLGAPNQIHTRSYADDYFVVVTPSVEPQTHDIRHAYLHYLLDPMATKYSEEWDKKRGVGDYAGAAPFLEDYYKNDFLLLATESLIKVIESRLAPPAQRAALVDQALKEGFVLAPHFAEQLPVYEKQEQAMRLYYPELIQSVDLRKEERRLDSIEFAETRTVRKARTAPEPPRPALTGAAKILDQAEQLYAGRELDRAREAYLRVLQMTDEKPLHAKSYYGLARIAALQRDPELAEKLFQRTLELAPEPADRAWCHIYLARLSEAAGLREDAVEHYRAALAVEGATEAAIAAAQKGLGSQK
ncbi:MAG: hypothetical protein ACK5AZ_18015 [Bryobacteraceae bacterium]